MSTDHKTRLANIKRFDQLIVYLRNEMSWPINEDNFEDITFEYTPEELDIDMTNAAKIQEIRRLRPLVPNQAWGIFFVKFEPKRLPVVALRRILSRVTLKRRISASSSERQTWAVEDLLFISNYGEGDTRQISFAHFATPKNARELPTLKVLGWDNRDTALHLDTVAKELTEQLTWPDNENDAGAWRKQWSEAFTLQHREVITTSKKLSIRLAELAHAIRERIKNVLTIETEEGRITKLMEAFQKALVHDLDADGFADMYAQTIAYGLLSARITDPNRKTVDDFAGHMHTNPLLRNLVETFLWTRGKNGKTSRVGIDFDELGVAEVVELLDDANMEAVIRDFGDHNPREDPVIHFYEDFLAAYDKEQKVSRGVFYTPRPVVSYIVRSVDELLRREFGLTDGLADITTWGEMVHRHSHLTIPEGVSPDQDFVQILDPAVGTGTFLVEVIDLIHRTLTTKWKVQGHRETELGVLWNKYVSTHLLTRLHGYELLMAPYAIAHLKLALKLYETGYRFHSNERARVFLTNALEPAQEFSEVFEFMIPALAQEAQAVNEIKQTRRFTVVIGNPPYSVSSWNTGRWIRNLVEDYKRTVRSEESQIQSLSNDYIKFLRLGEWHTEETKVGTLGMITGHGYLYGTQPRDLRQHFSRTYCHCYCLDLHGSIRRATTKDAQDEPVFQIKTGVAIVVAVRTGKKKDGGTTAVNSLIGTLKEKLTVLQDRTAFEMISKNQMHLPTGPYFYFAPTETAVDVSEEYYSYPDLPKIFGTGNRQSDKEIYWATGFASQQDQLAISFTEAELEEKMAALGRSHTFDDLTRSYRLCKTNQWNYDEAKVFAKNDDWHQYVKQVTYRPFDRRWTVFHRHVLTIPRRQIMSQLRGSTKFNLGLVSSRAVNDLIFSHCFVTNEPLDKIFLSSKTSTNAYVFPLFIHHPGDLADTTCTPNFSKGFLHLLSESLELQPMGTHKTPEGITADDIFCYIYSILHSPKYRARFGEFLKIDFPHIPLTSNIELFKSLARIGDCLVTLHLMESSKIDEVLPSYTSMENPTVGRIGWSDGTVWLDAKKTDARKGHRAVRSGTIGFGAVPEAVWDFNIGGYQVCHKWLKDRAGRTLSREDLIQYQRIVAILAKTIRLMEEIDEAIGCHGGWPGAFRNSGGEISA